MAQVVSCSEEISATGGGGDGSVDHAFQGCGQGSEGILPSANQRGTGECLRVFCCFSVLDVPRLHGRTVDAVTIDGGDAIYTNQAPTSLKTPPSPHRIFDLQDSLDKLMHFLPQLSDFVPLRNRFIVSAHRPPNITLLTLVATL